MNYEINCVWVLVNGNGRISKDGISGGFKLFQRSLKPPKNDAMHFSHFCLPVLYVTDAQPPKLSFFVPRLYFHIAHYKY